jgi:hypothetical protein
MGALTKTGIIIIIIIIIIINLVYETQRSVFSVGCDRSLCCLGKRIDYKIDI